MQETHGMTQTCIVSTYTATAYAALPCHVCLAETRRVTSRILRLTADHHNGAP